MKICKNKRDFMTTLAAELESFGIHDTSEILSDFEQHFAAGQAGGQTEEEVCDKLGDITEIAKQYVDEAILDTDAVSTLPSPEVKEVVNGGTYSTANNQSNQNFQNNQNNQNFGNNGFNNQNNFQNNQNNPNNPNNQNFNNNGFNNYNNVQYQRANQNGVNAGGIVAVVIIDVFVLAWAIPTLFSLVIALLSVPFALVVSGIGCIFGGVVSFFVETSFFTSGFSPLTTVFAGLGVLALGGLMVLVAICAVKGLIKLCKSIINWHSKMITGKPIHWKSDEGKCFDFSRNRTAFNRNDGQGVQ